MPPAPLLILASRSAQRTQLLSQAGYEFRQANPPFADPPQPQHESASTSGGPNPQRAAIDLAIRKAQSLRATGILGSHPHVLILAADTICVSAGGQLLGQPPDQESARQMIREFFGRDHDVITGVALLGANDAQLETFADVAIVHLDPIDDAVLQSYLDSNQWQGKAGGYNLFDRQHAGWPITVGGDPSTVVGLPMRKLIRALARRQILPRPTVAMHEPG